MQDIQKLERTKEKIQARIDSGKITKAFTISNIKLQIEGINVSLIRKKFAGVIYTDQLSPADVKEYEGFVWGLPIASDKFLIAVISNLSQAIHTAERQNVNDECLIACLNEFERRHGSILRSTL